MTSSEPPNQSAEIAPEHCHYSPPKVTFRYSR
jgi:hypothetical protein